jgi:hypothetical protein
MWWNVIRIGIAALTIAVVSDVSQRLPRLGALLLTLPVVSIIAFIMTWQQHHDLPTISKLSRETLILVPLGLPFFLPLGFADKLGLGFCPAFAVGIVLASVTIGFWLWLGPNQF